MRLETVSALCALAKAYSFQRQARAAAKCASLAVGVIEDTPSEGSSSPRLVPLLALRARLRLVCGEAEHAKDDELRAAVIMGMIEFLYPEVRDDIKALHSGAEKTGNSSEAQQQRVRLTSADHAVMRAACAGPGRALKKVHPDYTSPSLSELREDMRGEQMLLPALIARGDADKEFTYEHSGEGAKYLLL